MRRSAQQTYIYCTVLLTYKFSCKIKPAHWSDEQWWNTGGQCTTSSLTSKSISFVSIFYYSYHARSTLPTFPHFPSWQSAPLDWWVSPGSYCLYTRGTAPALSSDQHWFGIPGLSLLNRIDSWLRRGDNCYSLFIPSQTWLTGPWLMLTPSSDASSWLYYAA